MARTDAAGRPDRLSPTPRVRRAHLSPARGRPILTLTIVTLIGVASGKGAEMADQGTGSTARSGGRVRHAVAAARDVVRRASAPVSAAASRKKTTAAKT